MVSIEAYISVINKAVEEESSVISSSWNEEFWCISNKTTCAHNALRADISFIAVRIINSNVWIISVVWIVWTIIVNLVTIDNGFVVNLVCEHTVCRNIIWIVIHISCTVWVNNSASIQIKVFDFKFNVIFNHSINRININVCKCVSESKFNITILFIHIELRDSSVIRESVSRCCIINWICVSKFVIKFTECWVIFVEVRSYFVFFINQICLVINDVWVVLVYSNIPTNKFIPRTHSKVFRNCTKWVKTPNEVFTIESVF